MKTVFIIGGMGSGKSVVARTFAELGAPTLDLDKVGHDVLHIGNAKKSLVSAFGKGILDASGEIDRAALAATAFGSPAATELLTSITQPFIVRRLKEWLAARAAEGNGLAFVEVSAYDGSKGQYSDIADAVIAVIAPIETRIERAVAKGFDEADVRRRIERQPLDGERMVWADHVVENESSIEDVRTQVERIWAKLTV